RRTEADVAGPGPAGHSRLIAGPPLSLLGTPTLRPGGRGGTRMSSEITREWRPGHTSPPPRGGAAAGGAIGRPARLARGVRLADVSSVARKPARPDTPALALGMRVVIGRFTLLVSLIKIYGV